MTNDPPAQRTMQTIRFELNGEPVTAHVEPHHNVVELLQRLGLHGARVDTIERTGIEGTLDAVQQAFADCGAFQCGFCTPGFVLMTRQLLDQNPAPSEDEIRHYLSGNLCRCAAYPEIIRAVQLAARTRKAGA